MCNHILNTVQLQTQKKLSITAFCTVLAMIFDVLCCPGANWRKIEPIS